MAAARFGLGKKERIKSRKVIDDLFLNGKSFSVFPLRITSQFTSSEEALLQIGVTVSKRHFKKAVDRNRIKRLLREAYRQEKHPLVERITQKGLKGYVFFMFTGKTLPSFTEVREAMKTAINKLEQKLSEAHEIPR